MGYIYVLHVFVFQQYDPSHYEKLTQTHGILQVPTTQLAKMRIDPKFVELTADILEIFLLNTLSWRVPGHSLVAVFAPLRARDISVETTVFAP